MKRWLPLLFSLVALSAFAYAPSPKLVLPDSPSPVFQRTSRNAEGNTLGYRYDASGNLTNLIYPGGQIVTNFYDSHNRLTNVTDWAGRKTVFHYDLAGRVRKIVRPNGTSREVIYDDAGQTREIWERKSDGTPIALFKLKWDAGGRVEHEFIAPLPKPYREPAITATYDADNKLATWNGSGSQLDHDADGNLLFGPLTPAALAHYDYDARNRLVRSRIPNAGAVVRYGYDCDGLRVRLALVGAHLSFLQSRAEAGVAAAILAAVEGVHPAARTRA